MEQLERPLNWYWFRGNDCPSRLLQDVCAFRGQVLFEGGFRKSFGSSGGHFGDIQFSDFESFHVVAYSGEKIAGAIRVTPPRAGNVSSGILGTERYSELLRLLSSSDENVVEINRLVVDLKYRQMNLGRTLVYAAVGMIESRWDRNKMTVICTAGHSTRQVDFLVKSTDYERIPGFADAHSELFNDQVSFLCYKKPPYSKGAQLIEEFKKSFARPRHLPVFPSRPELGFAYAELG